MTKTNRNSFKTKNCGKYFKAFYFKIRIFKIFPRQNLNFKIFKTKIYLFNFNIPGNGIFLML